MSHRHAWPGDGHHRAVRGFRCPHHCSAQCLEEAVVPGTPWERWLVRTGQGQGTRDECTPIFLSPQDSAFFLLWAGERLAFGLLNSGHVGPVSVNQPSELQPFPVASATREAQHLWEALCCRRAGPAASLDSVLQATAPPWFPPAGGSRIFPFLPCVSDFSWTSLCNCPPERVRAEPT